MIELRVPCHVCGKFVSADNVSDEFTCVAGGIFGKGIKRGILAKNYTDTENNYYICKSCENRLNNSVDDETRCIHLLKMHVGRDSRGVEELKELINGPVDVFDGRTPLEVFCDGKQGEVDVEDWIRWLKRCSKCRKLWHTQGELAERIEDVDKCHRCRPVSKGVYR